jgi:hypothetical protein
MTYATVVFVNPDGRLAGALRYGHHGAACGLPGCGAAVYDISDFEDVAIWLRDHLVNRHEAIDLTVQRSIPWGPRGLHPSVIHIREVADLTERIWGIRRAQSRCLHRPFPAAPRCGRTR